MGQAKKLRKQLNKLLQDKKRPMNQIVLIQNGVLDTSGEPGPEYNKITNMNKKK